MLKNDCARRARQWRARGASQCQAASRLSVALATVILVFSVRPSTSLATAVFPSGGVRGGATGGNGAGGGGMPGSGAPAFARHAPRDAVLYDELEVHWGASAREIKKAYYRLAVQHHPDKRPGDARAQDRFKRLSEAYHILQDESVRERYHRRGMGALEEDGISWGGKEGGGVDQRGRWSTRMVDPMEIFQTFIGGGMFEHLIGPLSPRMVPVQDPDYHHEKTRALAENLERRLDVDVRGDSRGFDQAAWAEALQLRDESMGREILHTLGYVYQNYARRSLGKLALGVLEPEAIRGKIKFYSDQAHRVNNLLAAVSSTTRLYVHLQTRKPDGPGEEETVARVKEALWRVHRVDVEHTVQRACKMVLRDPRVPPSARRRRAEALVRLGQIFTAAARGKNPDPDAFRFVENASDPMAGMASAGWRGGDGPFSAGDFAGEGRVWPNAFAPAGGDLFNALDEEVAEIGSAVAGGDSIVFRARDGDRGGSHGTDEAELCAMEGSELIGRCLEERREAGAALKSQPGEMDETFRGEVGGFWAMDEREDGGGRPSMPSYILTGAFDDSGNPATGERRGHGLLSRGAGGAAPRASGDDENRRFDYRRGGEGDSPVNQGRASRCGSSPRGLPVAESELAGAMYKDEASYG